MRMQLNSYSFQYFGHRWTLQLFNRRNEYDAKYLLFHYNGETWHVVFYPDTIAIAKKWIRDNLIYM